MKKIEEMTIRPSDNGGHTVTHRMKREVSSKKMGDMYMSGGESETHVFGPDDNAKMMQHVSKNLGCD